MIRTILTYPDELLRQVAEPVIRFDDTLAALVADLFETLTHADGLGLAATQVGAMQRVVVMDCGTEEIPRPLALINPRIVSQEGELVWNEGCLSLPNLRAEINRSERVEVVYMDPGGLPHRKIFEGLAAVCTQHELDHLDGTLYIDHLGALEQKAVLAEYAPDGVEPPPLS